MRIKRVVSYYPCAAKSLVVDRFGRCHFPSLFSHVLVLSGRGESLGGTYVQSIMEIRDLFFLFVS